MLDTFKKNYLLKDFTTFAIGGPAEFFTEICTIATMQATIKFCFDNHIPFFILGKGSNVLFDDKGFKGLVIANKIDFLEKPKPDLWHVGAGYSFSLLGTQTARNGLTGLEFASGIPGSVGGAIFMNAGANNHETCETLISVDFICENGNLHTLLKDELEFSYRTSPFQTRKGVIAGATFKLNSCGESRKRQLDIINYRKQTQPYSDKSAGCVFKNPTCKSAGALIEVCGLKGASIGGAEVSTLHANFLVNKQGATAQDVLNLIDHVRLKVKDQTGIELESEIRFVPYESEFGKNQ